MKIIPSLAVSDLRNPKSSLCPWQKKNGQVPYLVAKQCLQNHPGVVDLSVTFVYLLYVYCIYTCKGFYTSPRFHLQVLLCQLITVLSFTAVTRPYVICHFLRLQLLHIIKVNDITDNLIDSFLTTDRALPLSCC